MIPTLNVHYINFVLGKMKQAKNKNIDKEWEMDLVPYEDLNFYHRAMKTLKERTGIKMANYNRLLDLNIMYQQRILKLERKGYKFQKLMNELTAKNEEIRRLKDENKKWMTEYDKLVVKVLKKAKVVY
jgi:hypothetical protein